MKESIRETICKIQNKSIHTVHNVTGKRQSPSIPECINNTRGVWAQGIRIPDANLHSKNLQLQLRPSMQCNGRDCLVPQTSNKKYKHLSWCALRRNVHAE